jgi:phi13 family phage major tail protein
LASAFGDDGVDDSAEAVGDPTFSMELTSITPENEALLLGHTYALGQTTFNKDDVSPEFAVGYKVWLGGSVFIYAWIACVRFSKPTANEATKESGINFKYVTFSAKARATRYSGVLRHWARTDDSLVPAATISGFFAQPVLSNSADLGALSVTLTEGTAGDAKKLKAVFAKVGGGSFSMDATSLVLGVSIVNQASAIVAGTWSVGVAGTTVTCLFTPTVAPSSGNVWGVIAEERVKDANGVPLTKKGAYITIA